MDRITLTLEEARELLNEWQGEDLPPSVKEIKKQIKEYEEKEKIHDLINEWLKDYVENCWWNDPKNEYLINESLMDFKNKEEVIKAQLHFLKGYANFNFNKEGKLEITNHFLTEDENQKLKAYILEKINEKPT